MISEELSGQIYLWGCLVVGIGLIGFVFYTLVNDYKIKESGKDEKTQLLGHPDHWWGAFLFVVLLTTLWPVVCIVILGYGLLYLFGKSAKFIAKELIRRDELKDE